MKHSVLQRFLQRNSINPAQLLPIVHSSESYVITRCMRDGILKKSPCDVFEEDLLYFFVGRPAYKKTANEDSMYWELPSCVLFDFQLKGAKRAYPFDTGAFRKKKYPNYLRMMDLEDFEIECSESSIRKAIGAFFQNSKDYYRLSPYSEERFRSKHDIDQTEEELLALHALIQQRSKRFDDRRFSIELQFSEEFIFTERKPIYCVVPETYLASANFIEWCGAYDVRVDSYPVYPLRKDYYYSSIYEKIENFYRTGGYYEI